MKKLLIIILSIFPISNFAQVTITTLMNNNNKIETVEDYYIMYKSIIEFEDGKEVELLDTCYFLGSAASLHVYGLRKEYLIENDVLKTPFTLFVPKGTKQIRYMPATTEELKKIKIVDNKFPFVRPTKFIIHAQKENDIFRVTFERVIKCDFLTEDFR